MEKANLPYRVEAWSSDGSRMEQVLAATSNYSIAKAAFEQAVANQPSQRMMLCDRARIIQIHRPG